VNGIPGGTDGADALQEAERPTQKRGGAVSFTTQSGICWETLAEFQNVEHTGTWR
jgi:hypothetical protein